MTTDEFHEYAKAWEEQRKLLQGEIDFLRKGQPEKIFKRLYTCGVNIQHEVGEIPVTFYPDVGYMKRHTKCWEQCGIVEVQVEVTQWVEPQKLFSKQQTKKSNARQKEQQEEGKNVGHEEN